MGWNLEFGSNLFVVFESQIQNFTLRRRVFAIYTTTSFHRSLLLSLPFEQKIGERKKRHKCTKTMTKYSSNRVWEKSVVFDSNTTDVDKSVVFGHQRFWSNSTDFGWMICVESGVKI